MASTLRLDRHLKLSRRRAPLFASAPRTPPACAASPTVWRWLFILLASVVPAAAQTFTPGTVYAGRNSYIDYQAGNLPLIFTAPHGGTEIPDEIPNRSWGTTARDTNAHFLAEAVAGELTARTGRYAHRIICRLSRTKLDANREIVEAAQGDPEAEQAWREYHGYIEAAKAAALAAHGFYYLVDLHGHGHPQQRLELGYDLGNAKLALSDAELDRPGYAWASYYRSLVQERPGTAFSALLRGRRSLGGLYVTRGFPACPSPEDPSPDADFFSGGYTTDFHTCRRDHALGHHGVQIETHYTGVRDSAASRAAFARATVQSLHAFLWDNYGFELGTSPLFRLRAATATPGEGGAALTLTVDRTGHRSFSETLYLTFGGTAVRGTDYTVSRTSLSFSSGQSSATFTLTSLADALTEGDETITIRLNPGLTQTADLSPLALVLTDAQTAVVRATTPLPVVHESAGAAAFTLTRTEPSTAVLTVPLVWGGDALAAWDHDPLPALATFPAGANTIPVTVPLSDDAIVEPHRTLTLTVLPADATTPSAVVTAEVELRDDDRPAALAAWLPGQQRDHTAPDLSGAARTGTLLPAGRAAGTTTGPDGAPAWSFDGEDDALVLPPFALETADGFTIAFRFRLPPGVAAANQVLASLGARGAARSLNIYLTSATTLRTWLNDSSGERPASALDATGAWTDGTWHHYTLTASASSGRRLYLDGVQVRSATAWTGTLLADEPLWLGWEAHDGNALHLTGDLQDLRLYHRAITAAEARTLATGQLTFAAWRAATGLPVTASATDDPEADGWPHLLEYALGSAPLAAAPAPRFALLPASDALPATTAAAARPMLTFARHTATSDTTWIVETATDLAGPWTAIATRPPSAPNWTIANGTTLTETLAGVVTVTAAPPPANGPRQFLRLRVTTP